MKIVALYNLNILKNTFFKKFNHFSKQMIPPKKKVLAVKLRWEYVNQRSHVLVFTGNFTGGMFILTKGRATLYITGNFI